MSRMKEAWDDINENSARTLCEKFLYSEFFWSVFSCIRTETETYGVSLTPYSVWIREDTDQKNSEYGHLSRSVSPQTLTDNAAIFRKDKTLLNLLKVRCENDVEPEVIQIKSIEPVRIQVNVEKHENNKEKITEKINEEEDEETKIAGFRFQVTLRFLHTLKAFINKNIGERQLLMKL